MSQFLFLLERRGPLSTTPLSPLPAAVAAGAPDRCAAFSFASAAASALARDRDVRQRRPSRLRGVEGLGGTRGSRLLIPFLRLLFPPCHPPLPPLHLGGRRQVEGRAGVEGAPRHGPRQRHPAPAARGGAPLEPRHAGRNELCQGGLQAKVNTLQARDSKSLRVNLRELWLLMLLTSLARRAPFLRLF